MSRALLGFAFITGGLIVSISGIGLLRSLHEVYSVTDIAYPESAQTFYNWLESTVKEQGSHPEEMANRIAQRLLAMRINTRRDTVNFMMTESFWKRLPAEIAPRRYFLLMARATETALKSSPLSGDLWLFAAWLRTNTTGFDESAAHYFALSQRFTPREEALLLQRLDFITQLPQPLPNSVKDSVNSDLLVVNELNPARAKDYAAKLATEP